ncbi:hypothetical protein ACO0QE_000872 [Hanseniaspora vineae]
MGVRCKITDTSVSTRGNFTLYHVLVIDENNINDASSNAIRSKHTVLKRFNDFYTFKTELEKQYKMEIPYDFPGKVNALDVDDTGSSGNRGNSSWLNVVNFYKGSRSTDPQVVEYRKRMLEDFLNDMLHDSFDTKWKYSKLTLNFLEIKMSDLKNVEKPLQTKLRGTSSLYQDLNTTAEDKDEWWDIYRDCKDILESETCNVSDIMRVRLKLRKLEELLNSDQKSSSRKSKKIKFFTALQKHMTQKSLDLDKNNKNQDFSNNLQRLMGTQSDQSTLPSSSAATFDYGAEPENSLQDKEPSVIQPGRLLGTNREMYQDQRQVLKDQEQGLEDLHKIILNQKNLGLMINQELQSQNELVDLLNNDVANTSSKLSGASRRAKKYNNDT